MNRRCLLSTLLGNPLLVISDSSKTGGKSYNELVSKEVERAVRDINGKFRINKAISIIAAVNSSFFRVLLFPFYTLLLDYFLQAR